MHPLRGACDRKILSQVCGTLPRMSFATVAGPYVASVVALGVAVWSDQMRRRDKRHDVDSSHLSEARNVVIESWEVPTVTNASTLPIRDVTLIGGDRFITKTGRYIDWHCEPTILNHSVASVALLKPDESHRFIDGEWQLFDQAGNAYGSNWRPQLDDDDHAVSARVEWTDAHGNHWAWVGGADPVRITARSPQPTFAAR